MTASERHQGPFRILVVEDNPHVAEIFQYAFKRIVHERLGTELEVQVEEAEDGHQAWKRLEASVGADGTPFDLLILDLMLPVMDGRMVLARLRATAGLERLPVLVVTAEDRDACDDAKRLGANEVLRKPVQFSQIRETIARML